MSAASSSVCRDPGRAFVYDNAAAFFLNEEAYAPGVCDTCGAVGVQVNGKGRCRAQAALTNKRATVAEGHPYRHDSPKVPGRYSLTDQGAAFLVAEDRAIVHAKVAPTLPLPEHVEVRRDLNFADLLDMVVRDPRPPFAIGRFDKKADMRFETNRGTSSFVVVDKAGPVTLDRARLSAIVALYERFGDEAVRRAMDARRLASSDTEKAASILDALAASHPELERDFLSVPSRNEPEHPYAVEIVNRRRARSAGAVPEEARP